MSGVIGESCEKNVYFGRLYAICHVMRGFGFRQLKILFQSSQNKPNMNRCRKNYAQNIAFGMPDFTGHSVVKRRQGTTRIRMQF